MTVRETGSGMRDLDGGSTDDVERGNVSRVQTRSTRPTAGDNVGSAAARTAGRGRDEAQSLTARCGKDVRPTNSLRRTVSMATHVNGSTSARSPTTPVDTQFSSGTHTDGSASARPSGNSDSHSDSHSDNFVDDYWITFIHPLSSAS